MSQFTISKDNLARLAYCDFEFFNYLDNYGYGCVETHHESCNNLNEGHGTKMFTSIVELLLVSALLVFTFPLR